MTFKSPLTATAEQKAGLEALSASADRAQADRARALLLTLNGWTSARIGEAFGVREDTVRQWRSEYARDGLEAMKTRVAPGPPPVKTDAALRIAGALLSAPVADRPNWTLARLSAEIEAREGFAVSRSQLSKALRKKGAFDSAGRAIR